MRCSTGDSEGLEKLFALRTKWPDSWDACWLSAVASESIECIRVLDKNGVEEPSNGWMACFSILVFNSNIKIAEYLLKDVGAKPDLELLVDKAKEYQANEKLIQLFLKYQ